MRLLLECKPDEALARELGMRRGDYRHSNDKGRVCKELLRTESLVGMIDEDPGAAQPRYLQELIVEEDSDTHGLRILSDPKRDHRVVIVKPRLEEWIIKTAAEAGVEMSDYGLSEKGNELHREINLRLANFERLLIELRKRRSRRLERLRLAIFRK